MRIVALIWLLFGMSVAASGQDTADPRIKAFNLALGELRTLFQEKRYQDAIAPGEKLVGQAREIYGENHLRYTGSLFNLGLIYKRTNRFEDARRVFEEAFVRQHKLRSPADAAYKRVLGELADVNQHLGRPRDTGRHYLAALKKLNTLGRMNTEDDVYYYAKAGRLMRWLADFEGSEKLLRHALAVRRKISKPDDAKLVHQLNDLAGLLRTRGKFEEAAALYKEAIDVHIKAKGEMNANTGILLDNFAVMHLHMGEPEKAEPYHKRAIKILEKVLGPAHLSTGIALANLAELYRNLGPAKDAEKLFRRALSVMTQVLPPNHPRLGVVIDNLAGLLRQQGKFAQAHEMYLKAHELLKAAHGPEHPEVGVALNNIGLVLAAMGRRDEAETRFLEALAIARKAHGDDNIVLATSLANLADVRIEMGKFNEARADVERAVALIDGTLGRNHRKLIYPLTRLAEIVRRDGNLQAALGHLRRAAGIYTVLRQRGAENGRHVDDNGAVNMFIEAAFELSAGDSGSPLQRDAFAFSQLKTLTLASAALDKLGARLSAGNPRFSEMVREHQDVTQAWASADKELLASVTADPKTRDTGREAALRAKIEGYASRLQVLDVRLAADFPEFAELSRPRPVAIKDIQEQLATDEVLLQYVVTRTAVFGWAITQRNVQWARIGLSRQALRSKVHALRCGLDLAEWLGEVRPVRCFESVGRFAEGDELPFAHDAAHDLYQALFKPFEAVIAERKLLVVASDALTQLPVQVLLTAPIADDRIETLREAPWLVRRHAVTVLPSASSLVTLRRNAVANGQERDRREPYFAVANPLLLGANGDDRSAFAVPGCPRMPSKQRLRVASNTSGIDDYFRAGSGNVARIRSLEPLPDTADEVCAVARDLGVSSDHILLGKSATEAMIRELDAAGNRLAGYRILHFATHGLISGELKGLSEPALVLSPPDAASSYDDGILTASEVAELNLDADWVVLSACNTAAGEGQGAEALSGLARSFFYAGARSLLVSHWPVRSDAAVALTTRAIGELAKNKSLSRASALQRAMLSVIGDRQLAGAAHPQVWAPFVVVGDSVN